MKMRSKKIYLQLTRGEICEEHFRPPSATAAHLGNYFGQIGGLPIIQKWTNLEISQQFTVQNINWMGVYFLHVFGAPECWPFWTNDDWPNFNMFQKFHAHNQNCQFMYLGPQEAGCFERWALNNPILNFFNNFLYKIKIRRGYILWKNLPYCRTFWKKGVYQSAQNGPIWKIFNHTLFKIQIERGSVEPKQILVFWAPSCGP